MTFSQKLRKIGAPLLAYTHDIKAGLLVSMLALPLSLGVAKASGFPAAMGVLTAMVGGLFTVCFRVSPLTIKGPAAGLITICAASVAQFGGGVAGWQATAGVILVAALLQMVFALLKFGNLSDFFPHSAVHGMLAAIGIIIIAKHIPVLLGDNPTLYQGEGPLELLMDIPRFVEFARWRIALIGLLGLAIMFAIPLVNLPGFKRIPAPMVVLLITVPLSVYWHFRRTEPTYSLVAIGNFWPDLGFSFNLAHIASPAFWKYVGMFLFVNSLESLLTVKAVDHLDPKHRTSSYNGDLLGVGAGNALSATLGGLPMISEVVRSSANVGFGARTKWANFAHGVFLLLAMGFLIPTIELIPNAALAAMLIYAGYRLAAPREFLNAYHIGKEQLVIFISTLLVTLLTDLLLGVAAGILVKLLFHLGRGAKLKGLFRARHTMLENEDRIEIQPHNQAIFTQIIGYKKLIATFPSHKPLIFNFENTCLVDHSFMAFVAHLEREANIKGTIVGIIGLEGLQPVSDHPMATRKKK
ncbi:MAG: SulP family inorganic anion transporter [Bacteroidetes bacterium]|nr:SulP family inorganic anion transporter [Bacteroidota bacterium]